MWDSNVGVMSAFAESGRSETAKSSEMTGRLRPERDSVRIALKDRFTLNADNRVPLVIYTSLT